MLQYNFPDPSGDKDAKISELNASMSVLRKKKAELMQHSKNLTSTLTRVLTEIEIIDIQIDQVNIKLKVAVLNLFYFRQCIKLLL